MPRTVMLTGLLAALAAANTLAQDTEAETERPAPVEDEAPREADTPPPPTPERETDDVFIPTEELGADEEVTFPVDI